jgi:hypothetical protein
MTSQAGEPSAPQSLAAAMAERRSLRDQFVKSVQEMLLRQESLRGRIVPTTKLWEHSRPHDSDKEAEFLILHQSFLELMNTMGESQRQSTALLKEVPSSGSTLKFIRNRPTPTKALRHERKVIAALQSELSLGMRDRSRILDRIDELADQMEELLMTETGS